MLVCWCDIEEPTEQEEVLWGEMSTPSPATRAQHADLTAVVLAAVVGRQQCVPEPLLLILFLAAAPAIHGCHRRPEAAREPQALHGHEGAWAQGGMRVLRESFPPTACCQACDAALPGQGVQVLKGLEAVQQVPADGVRPLCCCQLAATVPLPGQDTRRWCTEDCTAGALGWANS